MTRPIIHGIAPFFIVSDVRAAVAFYCDQLGFEVLYQGPSEDCVFFAGTRESKNHRKSQCKNRSRFPERE